MKRIVAGKKYDTETATLIAEHEHGDASDFHHVYEGLYRTRNGRYFVHFAGGPLSGYAEHHGPNLVSGSSGILALDAEAALEWCEMHHVDADVVEQFFVVEDA